MVYGLVSYCNFYWFFIYLSKYYVYYFEFIGEKIRFKVLSQQFTDTTPSGPSKNKDETNMDQVCPYVIYVSKIFIY